MKFRFHLNLVTLPLILFAVLIILKLISPQVISAGLLGRASIEPWKILILFFGSALISTSADKSGIFDHISVIILNRGHGRGIRLLFITYCLAWFLSVFASNDIVILTLTPIIFYFSFYSDINVIPLLFAEFIGANNGIFFITGNPVDTILATSLGLGQLSYLANTILPTLALSALSIILVYFYFRNSLTKKYKIKELKRSVRNWLDAKLSLGLLGLLIILLLISGWLKLELWQIILSLAALFTIKDLVLPFIFPNRLFEGAHGKLWRFYQTLKGMPWEILPFILVMFILMEVLASQGIFNNLATWLSGLVQNNIWRSSLVFGFFSLFLENIINNQPLAIMMSHIFLNPALQLSAQSSRAALYAVVLAGNAGASLTLVGSLAGLMWHKILRSKGLRISYWQFAKVGFFVVIPSLILSFVILSLTI